MGVRGQGPGPPPNLLSSVEFNKCFNSINIRLFPPSLSLLSPPLPSAPRPSMVRAGPLPTRPHLEPDPHRTALSSPAGTHPPSPVPPSPVPRPPSPVPRPPSPSQHGTQCSAQLQPPSPAPIGRPIAILRGEGGLPRPRRGLPSSLARTPPPLLRRLPLSPIPSPAPFLPLARACRPDPSGGG